MSQKINLGLFGSSGKMGNAVQNLLDSYKELLPYISVGKQESNNFSFNVESLENIEDSILQDVDIWIDFSSASGLVSLLKKTEAYKTKIVSGATGLVETDFKFLKNQSQKRAIFWASNLSPGLWAFRQALKALSSISYFDFSIEEIHHTQKKDKPSGTAKTLQNDLELCLQKKIETPQAHRLGGVFGVHTVYAASQNELISFQHQALNRSVFAEGALKAALWTVKQKPGMYSMDDLFLNLKKD